MDHVIVRLTPELYDYAVNIAAWRQGTAPARQVHGCEGGLAEHATGALGETAFALWCYGHADLTIGTYRALPDFPRTEVRTRTVGHWDLLVRRDDDPAMAYVLVVPFASSLGTAWRLPGWCWGHEARRPGWLKDHGGREAAWFVPQSALRPMATYRALVLEEGAGFEPARRLSPPSRFRDGAVGHSGSTLQDR